ncbi:amine oxidase [flavin-containing] A-like [Colletes gigas]|uniref:amine oxidase [flavin-containing] A-like n=1 Tax=Colletes gigas TaxID=935657 RepID=UPI001C9AEED1|nr:amine oxidase [flavin-containing] A-like [Colletes gigas]
MASDFIDEESVTEDYNDFDIIIIGAGLAGLTCAYNILKRSAGLEVLIIEANKEVGGRILKDYSDTFHVNSVQKHVTSLIKAFHIKTERGRNIDGKETILYTKYGPLQNLPGYNGAEVYNFLQTMEENALDPKFSNYTSHEKAAQLAETSVEQLLRRIIYLPYSRTLCRAFICSTCAMRNLNNVSALWMLVMLNGASGILNRLKITIGDNNRYFVQGGMTKIVQELFKNILKQDGKVKFVERVNEIKFNDDRAYVRTEKSYLKCEFVVVAVPPPMQNRIVIKSSPQESLNPQGLYAAGENVFFKLTYKRPPWINDFAENIVTPWDTSANLNISYDATHGNTGIFVLAGFLGEPNATQTHNKGLFDILNECFGTTEALRYVKYKEWNSVTSNLQTISSPMSVMKPTTVFDHSNYIDDLNGQSREESQQLLSRYALSSI